LTEALVNLADLLAASSVAFDRYLSVNAGTGSARSLVMGIGGVRRVASGTFFEALITPGIILIAAAVIALIIGAGRSDYQLETVATEGV
jgi:uncharacterized YccA/Bax inhibitor family protein